MSKPDDGKIHTPWKLVKDYDSAIRVEVSDSRKNVVMAMIEVDHYHTSHIFPGSNKLSHIVDCVNACGELDPKRVAELLPILVRLQVALGDFCCAVGISYDDMEDEHKELLDASNAADELIKQVKGVP